MSGETIPDIIGEINQRASFANAYGDNAVIGDGGLPQFLWGYANRLEAAYAKQPRKQGGDGASDETAETIPDIVREMLDYDGEVELFAVRINEAYARLPLLTQDQWTEFARQGQQLVEMKHDNELLRTALRRVVTYINREEWADRNLAALAEEAEAALNGQEARND